MSSLIWKSCREYKTCQNKELLVRTIWRKGAPTLQDKIELGEWGIIYVTDIIKSLSFLLSKYKDKEIPFVFLGSIKNIHYSHIPKSTTTQLKS